MATAIVNSPQSMPSLDESNNVELENDIMYMNFNQPITIESILSLTDEATKLNLKTHPSPVPVPVIIHTMGDGNKFKFGIADLSKIAGMRDNNLATGIIIVGLKGKNRKLLQVVNGTFYSNRMIFCDTLEEARRLAEPMKNSTLGILEQDRSI
jgi:hypothetical protein